MKKINKQTNKLYKKKKKKKCSDGGGNYSDISTIFFDVSYQVQLKPSGFESQPSFTVPTWLQHSSLSSTTPSSMISANRNTQGLVIYKKDYV